MKKFALLLSLSFAFIGTANAVDEVPTSYKVTVPSSPAFVPTKVWNDGQYTFIELEKSFHGDLPQVFAVAEDGRRTLVNWKWDDQASRIVVNQLLDRAVLVLFDQTVVITRS